MSDSKFYNEALDALYQAAKVSANFIEAALTSKDPDFDQERLEVALKVLKITWSDEEGDEDDDESEPPHTLDEN